MRQRPPNDDTLTLAGDFWDEDGTRVYAGSNCTVLGFMPFAFCFCRYQTTHKRGMCDEGYVRRGMGDTLSETRHYAGLSNSDGSGGRAYATHVPQRTLTTESRS